MPFPHLDWTKQASLYCINIRQFSEQGTFEQVTKQLPRLKAMGVGMIWLLPINPIGKIERKGTLGSYYASADYTGINPEFGTLVDFKTLVKASHDLNIKVIIDWVANHCAWDNPWLKQHPDWFKKNDKGEIFPVTFTSGEQVEYWTDVVALDYSAPALWDGMMQAMQYWVKNTDIDGFRCDVAGMVPTPFWERARRELDATKPMFMLAEWSEPDLHNSAFDMTYDWLLFEAFKKIARGEGSVQDLKQWWSKTCEQYPDDAYRMTYTANHDSNSWQGSDLELFGPAIDAMSVLAMTLPGFGLVYNGQESGLNKRLEFFERDSIDWHKFGRADFYKKLFELKSQHPALANGIHRDRFEFIEVGNDQVVVFRRQNQRRTLLVAVNLSGVEQTFNSGLVSMISSLKAWDWWIE
jgi:glycosidase